jgi:hypothetical protein
VGLRTCFGAWAKFTIFVSTPSYVGEKGEGREREGGVKGGKGKGKEIKKIPKTLPSAVIAVV